MPKVIIVEGPDAVGKSTIVNELTRRLRCVSVKHGVEKDFDTIIKAEQNAIEIALCARSLGMHCVFDRHWISEVCYGAAYRGNTQKEHDLIRDAVVRFLDLSCNVIYVMCLPEYDKCIEYHRESCLVRDEFYKSDITYEQTVMRYQQLYHDGDAGFTALKGWSNVMYYDRSIAEHRETIVDKVIAEL